MIAAVAVSCFLVGSAVQEHWDVPWKSDDPPMADAAAMRRLVLAQEATRELQVTRETVQARLAEEELAQVSDAVEASRADPADAQKINHRIGDRTVVLEILRSRLKAAIDDQVPADRELQVATERARKSEDDARDRARSAERIGRAGLVVAAWSVFALVFAVYLLLRRSRPRLVHERTVLAGSLAGTLALLLTVTIGWIAVLVVAATALAGWVVLRPGSARG
ncbi:hypothetical protein [Dactylosporangium sp. NPDC051541]|uniref:hypothetical protein n=1 Tax=Dactylosporangium sp. NPDC051541 TaxID=3363977 RepID=UPI0037A401D8